MDVFLEIILKMPTVLYTGILGFFAIYWLLTILGVVDLDLLGLDGVDGAVDGAVDGTVDGIADGMIDGISEGALDGVGEGIEGGMEIDAEPMQETVHSPHYLLDFLNFFHLRSIPLTISLSLLTLVAWVNAYLGSRFLTTPFFHNTLGFLLIDGLAVIFALFIMGQILKPFDGKLKTHQPKKLTHYLGASCTILSSKVDSQYGEAKVPNPYGAPLIVQVRCAQSNSLQKGDEALIISTKAKVLIVEPIQKKSHNRSL